MSRTPKAPVDPWAGVGEGDDILGVDGVAELLHVSERTVRQLVSERAIPHARLSARRVVFSRRRLLAWLAARCDAAAQEVQR